MKLEVYTKDDCTYCDQVKKFLTYKGYFFTEVKLNKDTLRYEFYDQHKVSSVPQVFADGELVGGYEKVIKSPLFKIKQGVLTEFNKTYKPFHYPWAVEITVRHEKCHWTEEEVNLVEDVTQWKSGVMSTVEKDFVTHILRLFTQSDVAVGQNYCDQFIPKFKNNEVRNMLCSIACREGTHQRAYALLNDTLGLSDDEYHAFLNYQEMSDKFDNMMDSDVNTKEGLALALAKSVFNEGVSLFASFIILINFQRLGKMLGTSQIVLWSARDETIHVEAVSKLLCTYLKENPEVVTPEYKQKVYDIAKGIVDLESAFVEAAFNIGNIEGLNADLVKEYVRFLTDRRLQQIELEPLYGVDQNPIEWVHILDGSSFVNFFENRVVDYEVGGLSGTWDNNIYEDIKGQMKHLWVSC